MRRTYTQKMSDKRKDKIAEERPIREAWLRFRPTCEGTAALALFDGCTGPLTVHEPWTRARGGPTDDPRNMATLCAEHNRLVSQDPAWMGWAMTSGLLVRAADGPTFMRFGGRFFNMSKEEAVRLVMGAVA